MSDFHRGIVELHNAGRIAELEDRISEKLKEYETVLRNGEGVELHRAQGWVPALEFILELPGEILMEKDEDRTTE